METILIVDDNKDMQFNLSNILKDEGYEVIAAGEVSAKDPLHRTSSLGDINLRRIKQSKPGGTWKDWDEDILSPCHKKKSGKTYSGVYARMSWEQDRALSLREGALLQTFPPGYGFIDPELPFSIKRLGTHIGNAVPVRLGYIIGKSITEHMEEGFRNGGQRSVYI